MLANLTRVFCLFWLLLAGLISASEVRYENGRKVEGDYKNGLKHGVWTYYKVDGCKSHQEAYQDGILHGKVYRWDNDGFLVSEENWRAGKRHGKSIEYWITGELRSEGTFHEGNGKLLSYHLNGKITSEMEYKNSKGCKIITWTESGQKSSEYTINEAGRYDGSYIYYQQNGDKRFELEYKDGTILKTINFVVSTPENWTIENGRIVSVWEPVLKDGLLNAPLSLSEFPFELTVDAINNRVWHSLPYAESEPCEYWDIPGKARITRIRSAQSGQSGSSRYPVEVFFDFIAEDPCLSAICVRDRHFTYNEGLGLKEGQMLCCILRKSISKGGCNPRSFILPDINISCSN